MARPVGSRAAAVATAILLASCASEEPRGAVGLPEREKKAPSAVGSPERTEQADVTRVRTVKQRRNIADGHHGARPKRSRLPVFRRPGANRSTLLRSANPIDQKLVLLIVGVRVDDHGARWLRVLLPRRPNGSKGWIRARDVTVVALRDRIEIDLSRYRLKHLRDGKVVNRFKVGIGRDEFPTPRGTFYVWAKVPQPNPAGPYGSYALGISGFSPVLSDWPGGGRAAIHGTANSSDRGSKVSHGCIRVFNSDMEALAGIPMGTPVVIRR